MLRVISFQRGETREVPDEQTLQTPQSVDLLGGVVDLIGGALTLKVDAWNMSFKRFLLGV